MDRQQAEQLAGRLLRGEVSISEFVGHLLPARTADLGVAKIDLDRRRRCGFPEVVFGPGKTPEALTRIVETLIADGTDLLATRISPEQASHLHARFQGGAYNALARTFRLPVGGGAAQGGSQPALPQGIVVIVTAGTSDLPIAEEARETALWMGVAVRMIHDVGVAGPHRLPEHLDKLQDADAVVVIAGMEGALPSVVGGYVSCPVVAVPTSVGYGASFGGITALLGMLNSCAANVTVVNIDSGFKGAYVASLIARNAARGRAKA